MVTFASGFASGPNACSTGFILGMLGRSARAAAHRIRRGWQRLLADRRHETPASTGA